MSDTLDLRTPVEFTDPELAAASDLYQSLFVGHTDPLATLLAKCDKAWRIEDQHRPTDREQGGAPGPNSATSLLAAGNPDPELGGGKAASRPEPATTLLPESQAAAAELSVEEESA